MYTCHVLHHTIIRVALAHFHGKYELFEFCITVRCFSSFVDIELRKYPLTENVVKLIFSGSVYEKWTATKKDLVNLPSFNDKITRITKPQY